MFSHSQGRNTTQGKIHRIAIPPTTAAPNIPQAAVSRATAPAVDVALPVEELLEEGEDEPLCAWPSAVDSFALRFAASPVNEVALTPVLFEQEEGAE